MIFDYCFLGDIITLQKGFAFKSKDYRKSGIRIIRVTNLNRNDYSDDNSMFIDEADANKYEKYRLVENDAVISTVGSWPSNPESVVGKVSIIGKRIEGSLLNQNAVIIRAKKVCDQSYLNYILLDLSFRDYIIGTAQGSASQASITLEDIKKYRIRLPEMSIQKKIASILNRIDRKISINTAINENLEQQAQALFKAWFVDFEPFGGVMPEDWIETTLGDVTRNIRTKINNNTTPVFSAVNSGNLVYSDDYFNKQVYSKDISKYIKVDNWDFAYNPARINIGSIGINDLGVIGCVSPVYVVFSVQEEYHSFFRFFFRQEWFKQQSLTRASGSVRQTLNYSDFSLIDVIYPNAESAKRFDVIWKSYYSVIERLRKENEKLFELRDTLIPRIINGEIDVSEVKI